MKTGLSAFFILCATGAMPVQSARAQGSQNVAISASLTTRHWLGAGLEVGIIKPVSVLFRVEGVGKETAIGAGVRVDAVRDEGAALYGGGMVGVLKCHEVSESTCGNGPGQSHAIAALGGVEFVISPKWNFGIEVVHWHSFADEPLRQGDQQSRFTFGAVIRYSPWRDPKGRRIR